MAWQRYIKNNEIKIQQFISAVFNWNLHRFFCMKFTYNGFYDTEGKLVSMRGVLFGEILCKMFIYLTRIMVV